MASDSFGGFKYNLVDVDRLTESHSALSGTGLGKRGLGYLTRSGVMMLCAAWELYLEHVLLEGLRFGASAAESPDDLPMPVQKELSKMVKNDNHELKPLELAGNGWRGVLLDYGEQRVECFNTPKAACVDDLFLKLLGIDGLSDCWSIGASAVDDFVTARGDIAHRGRHSQYVHIGDLRTHRDNICSAAANTDDYVGQHVRDGFPVQRKPWNVVR